MKFPLIVSSQKQTFSTTKYKPFEIKTSAYTQNGRGPEHFRMLKGDSLM